MNRRNLLKGAVTIPIATALSGCKKESPSKAPRGTLKVILNGPFGVVLHGTKDYRITAYVPSDPQHQHEFRFRGPMELAGSENKTGKSPSYYFELLREGLDIDRGRPRIDQGFYDFNLPHIGEWKLPEGPFVVVELPRPDFITFTPPAQPVLLGGKPTLQPLDHILEYRMSEPDRVGIKSGDNKPQQAPLCSEMLKEYQDYLSQPGYSATSEEYSQRKNMEEMLRSCAPSDRCLLFGVGLRGDSTPAELKRHGIRFFNQVLLPTLAPPALQKELQEMKCQPVETSMALSPQLMPAVFNDRRFEPRFLQVSAVLDCQYGGEMGTTP